MVKLLILLSVLQLAETPDETALLLLKRWEGLRLEAYKDADRYAVGWGSRGSYGEKIDLAEANKRVRKKFNSVFRKIRKTYPLLDNWQASIIAVTAYNVPFGDPLDRALKKGDTNTAAKLLLRYTKSNGVVLRGLERRRLQESTLLLLPTQDRKAAAVSLRQIVNKHIRNNG